ncbi:hypothetical protein ACFWBR_39420 [Streptomyces sp. NPDC060006]
MTGNSHTSWAGPSIAGPSSPSASNRGGDKGEARMDDDGALAVEAFIPR